MKNFFETRPRTAFTILGALVGLIFGVLIIRNAPIAESSRAFEGQEWLFGLAVGAFVGFRLGGVKWRQ